jgi:hypothetical protein
MHIAMAPFTRKQRTSWKEKPPYGRRNAEDGHEAQRHIGRTVDADVRVDGIDDRSTDAAVKAVLLFKNDQVSRAVGQFVHEGEISSL